MKKKITLSILILLLVFLIAIFFNQDIKRNVYQLAPDKIKIIYKILFKDKKFYTLVGNNKIENSIKDYNARFLPETQLIKVDFITKHLNLPENFNPENKKNQPILKEFQNDNANYNQRDDRIEYHYKFFFRKI